MRVKIFYLCATFLVVVLSGVAWAGPSRIISLGPSLTESVLALGVSEQLVGVTTYCKKPAEAVAKDKVGSAVEINVEKVLTLKPDIVLATSLSDPKGVAKLKSLGIHVEVFSAARNFDALCDEFLRLATLVGQREKAETILGKVRTDIEEVRKKTFGLLKPKVVVQAGANPLWVVPKDYFINDFVEYAGGENIIPAGNGHFSREKVLEMNPDVIIVTTMGIVGDEERRKWEQYRNINAVKNGRIYIVDSDKFCSPTPQGFVTTLKETVKLLHPEYE